MLGSKLGSSAKTTAIVCWTIPQTHLPASLTYNLGSQPIFPAHSCEVKLPSPPQQRHAGIPMCALILEECSPYARWTP